MAAERFVADVLTSFAEALEPLEQATATPDSLAAFLAGLGWTLDPPPPAAGVAASFSALARDLAALDAAAQTAGALPPGAGAAEVAAAVARLANAIAATVLDVDALATASGGSLPEPLDEPSFWQSLAGELADLLLYEYLRRRQPVLFGLLRFLGVAAEEHVAAAGVRNAYLRRTIDWGRLVESVSSPQRLLPDVYGWGGSFDHVRFLDNLCALLRGLHAPAQLKPPDETLLDLLYDPSSPTRARVAALDVPLLRSVSDATGALLYTGLSLVLLPIPAAGATGGDLVGLTIAPEAWGSAAESVDLGGGTTLTIGGGFETAGAIRLDVRPDGAHIVLAQSLPGTISAQVTLTTQPPQPATLLGRPDSTRLELAQAHAGVAVSGPANGPEATIEATLDRARLVLDLGDADGFLQTVLGSAPQSLAFALGGRWSSRSGFAIEGKARLDATIPVHASLAGVLDVDTVEVSLGAATGGSGAELVVVVSGSLTLGPVTAAVQRVGLRATAAPVAAGAPRGNLGDLDVGFGFRPPDGAALAVDTAGLVGSGFLDFDPSRAEYAGGVHLEFEGIGLTAVGILTTRLPDGSSGFSLLVIVAATGFAPIQLGFGFKLTAVGGLVGVNRTTAIDPIRAALPTNALDSILFMKGDPIPRAQQLVQALQTFFPAASGRTVFGPMATIEWGTPTLVTIQATLLLELPTPLRLVVLARLDSVLPDAEHAILSLHLNALGVLDFDRQELSLDAVLHDSKVLEFALTGGMALRAGWGDQPEFLLAIGGFNPHFEPPPAFPTLDRLAISLATGDDPRLRLAAYFALTSNTIQLGAHLDLYVGAGGFSVEGSLGFDGLVRFSPFSFVVDIEASLALKAGGETLLSISVQVTLSGPAPWHVQGTASFSILFFSITIHFDFTIGHGVEGPTVPAVDLWARLQPELERPASWSAQLPDTGSRLVRLRALDPAVAATLVHPLGAVAVTQRVLPLDRQISALGNAPVTAVRSFHIDHVEVGSARPPWTPTYAQFAPAQFRPMSDADKLSSPSFDSMPAGVQVDSGKPAAGTAAAATIAYNTTVFGRDGSELPPPAAPVPLPAPTAVGLASGGAAAAAPIRHTGRLRYATAVAGVAVHAGRFAVAGRDDLRVPGGLPATDGSFTAAADALALLPPGQQTSLQVVRGDEVLA